MLNVSPVANVGTSDAAVHVAAKIRYGDDAEQPRGVVGKHRFLAQQFPEIPVRLQQRRPRRCCKRDFALRTKPVSNGASASTSSIWPNWSVRISDHCQNASSDSRLTSAMNTRPRY